MNIESYLERISQKESVIKAWAFHDPELVRAQVRQPRGQGSLSGVPIGIKDLYDTDDMPTAYGSKAYEGHRPVRDSWSVQRLRAAGGIIMGKTVTTEFAYVHAGPTRNPHNPAHTPGGSSSGSAAAVAAGMVPVAIGSQTGGSVIRPSAYCGVIGFKPTYGLIPLEGASPLSPTMDTIGIHAAGIDMVSRVLKVLCPRLHPRTGSVATQRSKPIRIGWYPGPLADQAQDQAMRLLEKVREQIQQAGLAQVRDLPFAHDHLLALCDANRLIMHYEAARAHRHVFETQRDKLGAKTIELIEGGLATSSTAYEESLNRVEQAHAAFMQSSADFDVILTLSSPGEAPRFEEGTGSSMFNQAWTTLGVPCLTLPAGKGSKGLPLGIQLIARPGEDHSLLSIGQEIQQACLIA